MTATLRPFEQPATEVLPGANADIGEVRQAAGQQLVRWKLRAAHPATTRTVRDAAEVLVRTCEDVLAQVGPE